MRSPSASPSVSEDLLLPLPVPAPPPTLKSSRRRPLCSLLCALSLALLLFGYHSQPSPSFATSLQPDSVSVDDSPLAFLPDIDPAWYTLPHDGYRVVLLLCFGALCWAASLVIVERAGVPVAKLLSANTPSPSSESDTDSSSDNDGEFNDALSTAANRPKSGGAKPFLSESGLVVSGWRTAWGVVQIVMTLGVVLGLAHWWFAIGPGIVYLLSLAVVLAPVQRVGHAERTLLFRGLIRAFTPSLTHVITFSDVLLADFLTSFARVFADIYASLGTQVPAHPVIEPLLVSVPYLIRFRQCINEALRAASAPPSHHAHAHAHLATYLPLPATPRARHLANALKYLSALPVIYLSAATRHHANARDTAEDGARGAAMAANAAFALWIVAALVNTWYSIYWDVFLDWSLGVRPMHLSAAAAAGKRRRSVARKTASSPTRDGAPPFNALAAGHRDDYLTPAAAAAPSTRQAAGWPVFTRPRRAFAHPGVYYVATLADFVLRFLWALRLSSHVPSATLMSVAEVARRGMWCVLRMEREWCVAYHGGGGHAGAGPAAGLFKLKTVKRADDLLPLPVSSPGAPVDHVRELGNMVVTARGPHHSSHELGSNPEIAGDGKGGSPL